jgi:hypothetical protein
MNTHRPTRKASPLQRATSYERRVTYVIAGITGITLVMLFRSITLGATEAPIAQERLLAFIVTVVQVAVSTTSLVILHYQVNVAMLEIEQAEQAELRVLHFTATLHRLIEHFTPSQSGDALRTTADFPEPASAC